MVKGGCYCKCKTFLHDEASPPSLGLLFLSLLNKAAYFGDVLEMTTFSLTPREWNKSWVGETDKQ